MAAELSATAITVSLRSASGRLVENKDLAALSFVEAKASAALLGPPGVGKTHIAVALAVAVCLAGYSIYLTSLDDRSATSRPPRPPDG